MSTLDPKPPTMAQMLARHQALDINLDALAARNASSGVLNDLGRNLAKALDAFEIMRRDRDRLADAVLAESALRRVFEQRADALLRALSAWKTAAPIAFVLGAITGHAIGVMW